MRTASTLSLGPCSLALLSLLCGEGLAQLPVQTLNARVAPRAAWTAVTTGGTTTPAGTPPTTPAFDTTFRADTCGAASYDKLWVFGGSLGNNTATTTNDLWAFDAVAGTFTQKIAHGVATSPPARSRHSAVWNTATNKLVIFGGNTRGTTPALLGDTWEYDPVANSWSNVTPPSGSPSPRQNAAMAYDPVLGGIILFGGQTNDAAPNINSNETWLFLGGGWALLTPASSPPARSQHSLMTRPDFGDCLLCGGIDNGIATPEQIRFLDVWTWSGGIWTKISDCDVLTNPTGAGTTWPGNVNGNQAVYDPLRKRVVMQGGQGITVATNTLYVYGPNYGGSPSNYTSEFDCLTNSWVIYANPTTGTAPYGNNDAVIGRSSRYYAGFVAATGTVYKALGQNPAASGSKPAYNVYAYQPNPIAAAPVVGAGCSSSSAPLTLSTNGLPWTSRTFNATATGFPANSFGFEVLGWAAQSVPLAALHPAGGVGCNLLVSADVTVLLLPVAGTVQCNLGIPASSALAGTVLNMQAVCIEVDAAFHISSIASTNALRLTIGAL